MVLSPNTDHGAEGLERASKLMSDIRSVDGLANLFPRSAVPASQGGRAQGGSVAVQDRVEISDIALALGNHDSGIRTDKVASVRHALARGDYLTKDKLAIAVKRALQDLESQR